MGKRKQQDVTAAQLAEDKLITDLGNLLGNPNELTNKLAQVASEWRRRALVAEHRARELETKLSTISGIMDQGSYNVD